MKYNKDNTQRTFYNLFNTKIMFIGFITGIIPFIILLSILTIQFNNIPNLFMNTIVIAGIVTSISNSFILIKLFNEKNDI